MSKYENLKARVVRFDCGYDYQQDELKELGFKIGDEFEVTGIDMGDCSTRIKLKDYSTSFNSVFFEFVKDGEVIDIYRNYLYNPYMTPPALPRTESGEKPLAGTILNAAQLGDRVAGNVYGHPNFEPGSWITTSKVLKIEGDEIETRNSRYKFEWAPDFAPFKFQEETT